MNLKKKLDSMVGKTFMHNAALHKVLKIYENDDKVTLSTDKSLFAIQRDDLEPELNKFLPVDDPDEEKETTSLVCTSKSKIEGLLSLVESNIKLVQEDSKNISKANSINNSIKNIIEIAKLELVAAKMGGKSR